MSLDELLIRNSGDELLHEPVAESDAAPIKIHTESDFVCMRKSGKLASGVLDYIADYVLPGVSTNRLDQLCHDFIIAAGAIPAPLNYRNYPKSICTSRNHVVCHGIPDDMPLKSGDILNIDVTVILDGWHGDTSRMFYVGNKVSIKAKRLCEVTYNAMMSAIFMVKPGVKLAEIGNVINDYVDNYGYSVVRDFCGHGIGRFFHASPHVMHYRNSENGSIILEEGMFFTVEPMINAGKSATLVSKMDGWTVTSRDFSLSAQFEHTVGVTKEGVEIFTFS